MAKTSVSRKVFLVADFGLLILYALAAILPILHLAAVSVSKASFAESGLVGLLPKEFNLKAYEYIFADKTFFLTFWNSIVRILTGVPINMLFIVLASYALSRPRGQLAGRPFYSWFLIVAMLFSGGIVPTYMLVVSLKLSNTLLALILPGAVQIYSIVLMLNFFKQVPEDLHEAAAIDGAGEFRILFRIYIPLSVPSLLTVMLFSIVSHWNSWLDGVLYFQTLDKMPLQSYLQSVVVRKMENNLDSLVDSTYVSQVTLDAARLFLAVIPVMLMYIPIQKYFVRGLMLGSLKG